MIVARGLRASFYGWVCAGAALVSSSCVIEVNTDPRLAPATEKEIWTQHFNEIVDEFNAGLHLFAGEVTAIGGAGARVFWVSAYERLHSYDVSSMKRIDYELPITSEVYPPFEVGTDVIVTAKYSSDAWQISAYAVDEPNTLIDTIAWPAKAVVSDFGFTIPPPIAIEDSNLYLIDPESVLHRWRPGMGAPEPLFSLTDRGVALGMAPRISVHGDDVLVLDNDVSGFSYEIHAGGALWHVGLAGGEAQKVADAASMVCFRAGEAMYRVWPQDAMPVWFRYSSSDHQTEDLSALVRETGVDLGDLDVDSEHLTSIFRLGCQPGGFTFETRRGLFFFDQKEREAQALRLERIFNPEEESTFYPGAAIVEHVAFVWLVSCPAGDHQPCRPREIHMRDLSAH